MQAHHRLFSGLLVDYAIQIAHGMEHLHSVHVAHRSLTVKDVLVDTNNIIKIADFSKAQDFRNKREMRVKVTMAE
jgi:serine/threonine protein kinase